MSVFPLAANHDQARRREDGTLRPGADQLFNAFNVATLPFCGSGSHAVQFGICKAVSAVVTLGMIDISAAYWA
jgi:hypothetical protein